jgi:3-isopropylmalate/(R)-2-methylmalate dehydratase small subunit
MSTKVNKMKNIRGRVWKFGNNINTTDISPGEMFGMGGGKEMEPKEIVFAAIRPDWKDKVRAGDCIVAGDNFGFGSHRESANQVMLDLGLTCIVANSISRLYFRNSIAMGFPAFPCPGVSEIFQEGDQLELDIEKGLVKNLTTGKSVQGRPMDKGIIEMLEGGGIMPLIVKRARGGFLEHRW